MSNVRKVFWQLSWVLCVCFALVGKTFAEGENKFSVSDVEKFVLEAKDYAIAQGKDKALMDFMDPNNKQFRRGSLYIFAQDFTGINLAHIKESIVGTNMMNLKDPKGVMFIQEMTKVAKSNPKGGWVDYLWQNPTTSTVEGKHTFVVKVDDTWWVGAGIYDSEKKQ